MAAKAGERSMALPQKTEFYSTLGLLWAECNSIKIRWVTFFLTFKLHSFSSSCAPCLQSWPALARRLSVSDEVNALCDFTSKTQTKGAGKLTGQHNSRAQACLGGLTWKSACHAAAKYAQWSMKLESVL